MIINLSGTEQFKSDIATTIQTTTTLIENVNKVVGGIQTSLENVNKVVDDIKQITDRRAEGLIAALFNDGQLKVMLMWLSRIWAQITRGYSITS